jgi:hypothetical protein
MYLPRAIDPASAARTCAGPKNPTATINPAIKRKGFMAQFFQATELSAERGVPFPLGDIR